MRISDWSSDGCSSDLYGALHFGRNQQRAHATCHRIARLRQHGRQAGVNIAGNALALRDRRHAHQQCKFIAANTADQIFAAHDRGYPLGESTQDFVAGKVAGTRSEEHTSELQSLMRISYAVFCLKKKNTTDLNYKHNNNITL